MVPLDNPLMTVAEELEAEEDALLEALLLGAEGLERS
jgi:hypothetical protein